MTNRTSLNLDVDLRRGVVPISKAASSLAALIKRAHATSSPIIVTQKGYPTGVLLPIELFAALKSIASGEGTGEVTPLPEPVEAVIDALDAGEADSDEVVASSAPPLRAARRRKAAKDEAAS